MPSNKLIYEKINLGADPELFIANKKGVIGSEKLLPKEGILTEGGKIIRDGVQLEINPQAATCREILARNIKDCFLTIRRQLAKKELLYINFKEVVEVSEKEMKTLSEDSKVFGCAPSNNIYTGKSIIKVDPRVYRYRSAGGHIHLGKWTEKMIGVYEELSKIQTAINKALEDPKRTVPMLDLIVGNTCVLVDRDPLAKERRKVYGKAGEFRTPPHGIEYRTLSNFWLKSYPLMSFVMGLARLAVLIVANDKDKKLMSEVKIENVAKAINENDFELAYKNFKKIEKPLLDMIPEDYDNNIPLASTTIKEFKHFLTKDLSDWFKTDPMDHWCNLDIGDANSYGWENFLKIKVHDDMMK